MAEEGLVKYLADYQHLLFLAALWWAWQQFRKFESAQKTIIGDIVESKLKNGIATQFKMMVDASIKEHERVEEEKMRRLLAEFRADADERALRRDRS